MTARLHKNFNRAAFAAVVPTSHLTSVARMCRGLVRSDEPDATSIVVERLVISESIRVANAEAGTDRPFAAATRRLLSWSRVGRWVALQRPSLLLSCSTRSRKIVHQARPAPSHKQSSHALCRWLDGRWSERVVRRVRSAALQPDAVSSGRRPISRTGSVQHATCHH